MHFFSLFISLLITAIWGFNFVAVKYCLHTISPLMLCFFRFFLASIPFIFFIPPPKGKFSLVVLYGLIMFALQFALLFLGLYLGMEAGLTSLLLQIQVFFSLFLGIFALNEKIRSWNILGCAISFVGIGIVLGHLDSRGTILGFLPILGTAACSSVGNLLSKKLGNVNSLSLVAWGSFIAWPVLLLFALLIDGPESVMCTFFEIEIDTWIGIGYITYLSTLFAYGAWSWLITNYPLRTITPFTLLTPVFALLFASIFLDEVLALWKIFAAILVLTGLAINLYGHHLLRIPPPLD